MNWYLAALKNYRGFSGRARRKEYWMYALFNALAVTVLYLLAIGVMLTGAATQSDEDPVWPWLIAAFGPIIVYCLGTIVPTIAVTVRRLHDTGRSGWWYLLALVPYGGIVILVFALLEGEPRNNKYGLSPKPIPAYYVDPRDAEPVAAGQPGPA